MKQFPEADIYNMQNSVKGQAHDKDRWQPILNAVMSL
jgi:hypothetical protein